MADRPRGYGLTAELEAKKAMKYDHDLTRDVFMWIEEVIGEPLKKYPESSKDVTEILKDGVLLCKLANVIQPGSVKINTICTVSFMMVINTIHALGRKVSIKNPALGPRELYWQQAPRTFTEEQLKAGSGVIGLQMGSNKGASQSGMNFGLTRQVK